MPRRRRCTSCGVIVGLEFKGADTTLSYEGLDECARVFVLEQGALLNGRVQQRDTDQHLTGQHEWRKIVLGPTSYLLDAEDVISLGDKSSWVQVAFEALGRAARLRADWDSYGSPPVSERARHSAVDVILLLGERDLPHPNVVPVPGGGIQFEWELSGRELELEIEPDGLMAKYLKSDADGREEEDSYSLEPDEATLRLIDWLCFG